jgi:hypothetical protein
MSQSLQHILISVEEYDRLKTIEKQFEELHKGIKENLLLPSKLLHLN